MKDIRQTLKYADYLRATGWIVERVNGVNYFIKKFPLIGSVVKIQRPEIIDHNQINNIVFKYKVFKIILEPLPIKGINFKAFQKSLALFGYKPSRSFYLPTKTLVLETTSIDQIRIQMKSDARQIIKKSICETDTIPAKKVKEFFRSWKRTVGFFGFCQPLNNLVFLKKIYNNDSEFIVSRNRLGEIISGAIFLKNKNSVYYWSAFTNNEGRHKKAQYKIVWEGIRWAINKNARYFDFEGIYDERFPNKSWLGFSHFKKSFGGQEIEYPGCYTKHIF